jgi:F-type H+-transporting ATPase subunit epsilon
VPEFTPYPVELITPEGIAFSGDAERLVVPGAAGELGILANHAPLISLLEPGETRLTDADGTVRRYATDDGFLQVRKNHALVLVGEAVAAENIDASDAGRRLDEARAALERANDGDGDGDVYAARREVGFAEALVKTAAG